MCIYITSMPKRTDPANLDNPIRKLRRQLGITQDRLAEILGTNGNEIRNLENGRMKMRYDLFKRITSAIGAEHSSHRIDYSGDRNVWLIYGSKKPCDPTTFMIWRQSSRPNSAIKKADFKALSYRIAALLAHTKPDEYNVVFTKISKFLEECLLEHPSAKTKDAFKRSAIIGMHITGTITAQQYQDGTFRGHPTGDIKRVTRRYKDLPSFQYMNDLFT
jgi:transcriptional regulator with XRE-family HTH domain